MAICLLRPAYRPLPAGSPPFPIRAEVHMTYNVYQVYRVYWVYRVHKDYLSALQSGDERTTMSIAQGFQHRFHRQFKLPLLCPSRLALTRRSATTGATAHHIHPHLPPASRKRERSRHHPNDKPLTIRTFQPAPV